LQALLIVKVQIPSIEFTAKIGCDRERRVPFVVPMPPAGERTGDKKILTPRKCPEMKFLIKTDAVRSKKKE